MKVTRSYEGHGGVRCPMCGGGTSVTDSRPVEGGKMIRRRRQCMECQHRITTFERALSMRPDRAFVDRVNLIATTAKELVERISEIQMILDEIEEERDAAPRVRE